MGYVLSRDGMNAVLGKLGEESLIYAPVVKKGEGRFEGTDVVRYDFVRSLDEIAFDRKSDYSFKEILTPLSDTLFFFADDQVTPAGEKSGADEHDVVVFARACDIAAVKRLDQMFLHNGPADPFYQRIREHVSFVLMGCAQSFETCFCASMGTNVAEEGWRFSVDLDGDEVRCAVKDEALDALFAANAARSEDVEPAHVDENPTRVRVPETVPNELYKDPLWDEYTKRCLKCGRCTVACPTCTCWTMQDTYYTPEGRAGERRRVQASCMIDGYTNVAGGGQYRCTGAERMRFKVLHKVYDFRRLFGYDMCVGCGRCDAICPEYISFANCVNKLADAVDERAAEGEVSEHE